MMITHQEILLPVVMYKFQDIIKPMFDVSIYNDDILDKLLEFKRLPRPLLLR